MTAISTVLGVIDSRDLGKTFMHEHVIATADAALMQFPHIYEDPAILAEAVEKLSYIRDRGITSIFDPTVLGLGRNIRFMRAASEASGVSVVPATGIYTFNRVFPPFATRDVGFMADAFIHDAEIGIQCTDIKAAFLKCATDARGITEGVEKVLRATARAHRATGIPIMTHTSVSNRSGLSQQDILDEEGVDLSKVIIGHSGDTEDIAYLEEIIGRGSYIGMDRYGLDDRLPTASRNAIVATMCQRGHANKMLLAHDSICCFYDESTRPDAHKDWRISFIVDQVLEDLERLGVSETDLDLMMIENPRKWIEPTKSY